MNISQYMLVKTLQVSFIAIFVISACSEDKTNSKNRKYSHEYVVTQNTIIDDSIAHDKTIEHFALIDLKDSICTLDKLYFHREYENLNSQGTAYLIDSIRVKFELNSLYEIQRILNYGQIYAKIKKETDKLIAKAQVSRKEAVTAIVNLISLDSSNIVNMHTQEIQIFNLGLLYLYNKSKFDLSILQAKQKQNYTTLSTRSKISFSELIEALHWEKLAALERNHSEDLHFRYEIIVDERKKIINSVEYSFSFKIDDQKFEKRTKMILSK